MTIAVLFNNEAYDTNYENEVRQYSAIKTVKTDSAAPQDIPIEFNLNTVNDVNSNGFNFTSLDVGKPESSAWTNFPKSSSDQ